MAGFKKPVLMVCSINVQIIYCFDVMNDPWTKRRYLTNKRGQGSAIVQSAIDIFLPLTIKETCYLNKNWDNLQKRILILVC